jgi:hypothetical protein
VRAAVESHRSEGLGAQLLAAVDGIAEVDPGADSDLNVPPPSAPAMPRPDDVGDDIEELQALDIDVDMPNASPRGREEYERALDLYDRANRLLLKDDPSEVELYEARRSIEEGRTRLAAARDALGAGQT